MVEFGMTFPVLIIVLFEFVQICLLMHNYLSMDKAVRGAARLAARSPASYATTRATDFLTNELRKAGASSVDDATLIWPNPSTVRVVASATFPYPLSSLLPVPTKLSVSHDQPYLGE